MKRYIILAIVLIVAAALTFIYIKNQPKLEGKKILMIIAHRNFERPEFEYPKEIFEREGAEITVASSNLSEATSDSVTRAVLRVKPDILIDDINVNDFDAVLFIGGRGSAEYFDDPTAHTIAKQTLEQGKILASICFGSTILANAGLLQGKKATCFQSYNITSKGAIYTGKGVERDGNIITARGFPQSKEFGEKIVAVLSE